MCVWGGGGQFSLVSSPRCLEWFVIFVTVHGHLNRSLFLAS